MASSVTVQEAKAHLEELLDRVEGGEEIVIEKDGGSRAKIVPLRDAKERNGIRRGYGENLLGITYLAPGWDAPMTEEELKEWGL